MYKKQRRWISFGWPVDQPVSVAALTIDRIYVTYPIQALNGDLTKTHKQEFETADVSQKWKIMLKNCILFICMTLIKTGITKCFPETE